MAKNSFETQQQDFLKKNLSCFSLVECLYPERNQDLKYIALNFIYRTNILSLTLLLSCCNNSSEKMVFKALAKLLKIPSQGDFQKDERVSRLLYKQTMNLGKTLKN